MNGALIKGNLTWLGNHSLQAGVLVLLVLVVQWLFRRSLNNRWRFALWWIVLARLLLPFSLQSTVSVFNFLQPNLLWHHHQPVAEAPRIEVIQDFKVAANTTGADAEPETIVIKDAKKAEAFSAAPSPAASQQIQTSALVAQPTSASKTALSVKGIVFLGLASLWLSGVVILSVIVIAKVLPFYRKIAKANAPAEPVLQKLLDDCCREFGISRRVELLETDHVESPALFGLMRLRLLLPKGISQQFCERELRYVFLHELAHVKRGDLWMNWLVTVLQIVHWFNPMIWFGFARLRADRELACDEMALMRSGDKTSKAYGETVVKLLENLSRPTAIPGLVGILEDKNQMRTRISMIANFRRTGRWSLLACLLIIALTLVGLTDRRNASASPSAEDAGFQLSIELRDGSHMMGKSLEKHLDFHSPSLGDMKIPLADIRSIEFESIGDKAHLKTTNDDSFDVQFLASSLHIETGFGKIELPVKTVRSIRISAAVKPGEVPSSGLISYWSGDGDANDTVGNNNGVIHDYVGYAPGMVGQAFDFDGSGGFVEVPDAPNLRFTNAMTVEAWIYLRSYSGPGSREIVSKFGGKHLRQCAYTFSVDPADGRAYFIVAGTNYPDCGKVISSIPIPLNQWVHLAATYNGSALKMYVNGKLDGESSWSDMICPGHNALLIGGTLQDYSRPTSFFNGFIDEVRLFDRALSDSEIEETYRARGKNEQQVGRVPQPLPKPAVATNDLNRYLTIELQDGSRVLGKAPDDSLKFHSDSLGDLKFPFTQLRSIELSQDTENANLTMANGDKFIARLVNASIRVETEFGKVELPKKFIHAIRVSAASTPSPQAQSMSGLIALWRGEGNAQDSAGQDNGTLGGNVTFGPGKNGSAFNLDGTDSYVDVGSPANLQLQNFTIEGWIRRFSDRVVSRTAPNGTLFGAGDGGYAIGLWADGRLYLTKSGVDNFAVDAGILDTNYHHIAVTKSGRKVVFYVDGTAFRTPQQYYQVFDFGSAFSIGAQGGDQAAPFYGAIDELGIFNRALTANEIQQLYNDGNNATSSMPENKFVSVPQKTVLPTAIKTTNETGFRLTIRLQDGSLVNGKALDEDLHLHSQALGDLKLALSNIRSLEFKDNGQRVHLTTTNGDAFDAQINATVLHVETGFGKTEIPVKLIQDVRIAIMRNGGAAQGLVARWSGENNAEDSIGGNNGMLGAGASFGKGVVGEAFNFSQIGDTVTAPTAGLPVGNSDRTMEGWIYIHSFIPGGEAFIAGYGTFSVEQAYLLTVGPNHALAFSQWGNGVDGPTLVARRWYHVAVTTKGESVDLYLDGELVGSGTLPFNTPSGTTFYIGGLNASGRPQQMLGKIDEMSVYNRALSSQEIKDIYEEGRPNIPIEPVSPNTPPRGIYRNRRPYVDSNQSFDQSDIQPLNGPRLGYGLIGEEVRTDKGTVFVPHIQSNSINRVRSLDVQEKKIFTTPVSGITTNSQVGGNVVLQN